MTSEETEEAKFVFQSDSPRSTACEDVAFKTVVKSPRKGSPLLDYFAPHPLAYLPYFHGPLSPSEADELLQREDDFLIFLDEQERLTPTIVVRDSTNQPQFIRIEQKPEGCFCFQDEDELDAFVTIHSLVVFYANYGVPIKTKSGAEVRLGNEVQSRHYENEITVEEVQDFQQLSYYHKDMDAARCGSTLLRDGEFLLWSTDANSPESSLTLSARWENKIEHIRIKKDSSLSRYILPKENPCRPVESVSKIDSYVKSLVRGKVVLNGVQLLRSVPNSHSGTNGKGTSHTSDDSYSSITSVNMPKEAGNSTIPAIELARELVDQSRRRGPLLGIKAPRPLHLLPYFFGECHPSKANEYLQLHGDFLVFIDSTSGRATLGVKFSNESSTTWWHLPIQQNSAGYFWLQMSDIRKLFTNIDQLISYYHDHREPLLGEYRQIAPELNAYLLNPVIRGTDQTEYMLEPCKFVEDLSYYFGKTKNEDLVKLLLRDGDYLLRRDDNNAVVVSARWQDVLRDICIESYLSNGYYRLPPPNTESVTEYAKSVDEFLKILVRNQVPLQGVILKEAVRKLPKYEPVRIDVLNE